jgi:hypothetical protein
VLNNAIHDWFESESNGLRDKLKEENAKMHQNIMKNRRSNFAFGAL